MERAVYFLAYWSKLNDITVKLFIVFVKGIIPLVIPIGQENVRVSHYYFDHGDQKINCKIITLLCHTQHHQQKTLYMTLTHPHTHLS